MKYQIYEETFIHPATGLLIRRFKGQGIVTFSQKMGQVEVNLNYMPARAKPGEIVDIVNRAMNDFNLPGTLYYQGKDVYMLSWIKFNNAKFFSKGIVQANLAEEPTEALGIKEPEEFQEDRTPIYLTAEDWAEIYYALEYKRDFNPAVDGDKEWIGHLNNILEAIGPDGEIAAASGVEANG